MIENIFDYIKAFCLFISFGMGLYIFAVVPAISGYESGCYRRFEIEGLDDLPPFIVPTLLMLLIFGHNVVQYFDARYKSVFLALIICSAVLFIAGALHGLRTFDAPRPSSAGSAVSAVQASSRVSAEPLVPQNRPKGWVGFKHKGMKFEFQRIRVGNDMRSYILSHPSYGSLNAGSHETHRNFDSQRQLYYVCTGWPPETAHEAREWARAWCRYTEHYIRTGEVLID